MRVLEYTLLDTDKYAIEHQDSCLITAVHASNIKVLDTAVYAYQNLEILAIG